MLRGLVGPPNPRARQPLLLLLLLLLLLPLLPQPLLLLRGRLRGGGINVDARGVLGHLGGHPLRVFVSVPEVALERSATPPSPTFHDLRVPEHVVESGSPSNTQGMRPVTVRREALGNCGPLQVGLDLGTRDRAAILPPEERLVRLLLPP